MTATTADREVNYQDGEVISYLVGTNENIPKGVAVTLISGTGYAVNGTDGNSNTVHFLGVSAEGVDNTAGAAGAKDINVRQKGVFDFVVAATAAQTWIGSRAYLTDNQTVAIAANTSSVAVGVIVGIVSYTKVRVKIDGYASNFGHAGAVI